MSRPVALLLSALPLVWCPNRIDASPSNETTQEPPSAEGTQLRDEATEAWRRRLLTLAFEAASKVPHEPHIKTRSSVQEAVVTACLKLGQPGQASACIERIDNWRRGAAYADLAYYCVENDVPADVEAFLEAAERIANGGEEALLQGWRRDRIRIKVARTRVLLGQTDRALELERNVVDSEAGKVDSVRAKLLDDEAFDAQLVALDRVFDTGNLDHVRNALNVHASLFDRFFEDEARRSRVEEQVRSSLTKVPRMVALDLLMDLAHTALEHADPPKALDLIAAATRLVEEAKWTPEDRVKLDARLAGLRYRAGERDAGREGIEATLALYEEERDDIVDIWRADVLRSVAEVYRSMGGIPDALRVYRRAIEEGALNPNSRPRAEDFVATCCSMAVSGVEPDEALWSRMRDICGELDLPW